MTRWSVIGYRPKTSSEVPGLRDQAIICPILRLWRFRFLGGWVSALKTGVNRQGSDEHRWDY